MIAWGAAYFLAAMLPSSRKAVLPAGGAGKLVYFAACVALFSSGVGRATLLVSGVVDLAIAALFTVALLSSRHAKSS